MKITIADITKKYRKKQVLCDVQLEAQSGKCIGILGGNGSGKSTLLSILAGVLEPDKGSFLCDDRDLLKDAKSRAQLVGYVPQGTPLLEELTAWDNLLLGYDKKELLRQLDGGVLAMLGVGEFLKTQVSKLSGGMKKRLSIGCAVAAQPPILLLDEPTAALDLVCKQEISRYLKSHKEAGGILLLATHDVQELSLCDEWYILKDGKLTPFTYEGDVDALVARL